MRPVLFCLTLAACTAPSLHAHAQLDPISGAEFLTITAAGNPAWPPGPTGYPENNTTAGRGSVAYDYRIAKTEVTTAQWVEFMNAVFDRPESDRIPFRGSPPSFWGAASTTPNTPGARRWRVLPGRENLPVSAISWRAGAIYCNWLHNGKSLDRSAFLTGAYDVGTFGVDANGFFTDQAARSPGARYFIPTLDEWMKAAHYDPNKNGPGAGGWWVYPNSSDRPPVSGPPGRGETSAGTWNSGIPLMSYPTVKSPWGLLDVSGGNSEWTESVLEFPGQDRWRWFDGSSVTDPDQALYIYDAVWAAGADYPDFELSTYGLRIAAPIPSPGTAALAVIFSLTLTRRRRRAQRPSTSRPATLGLGLCLCGPLIAAPASAQIDPVSGAEFLTITAAGNPAWPQGPTGQPFNNTTAGRGSVAYDYRIAKTEVTTAQWVEFMNAVFDRPESDRIPFRGSPPSFWGAASTTPNTPGARRWRVLPGRENLPVSAISWRAGAIYCNWLHNGKSLDRSAFLTGAYDVGTFGVDANGFFTDQAARSPGARYFIPTLDEWMKAAHYDPNKNGPGAGGWWVYPNSSDTAPVSGPPGRGETSAGTWNSGIPLMSYPTTKSPWGLLDVSGGNSEWTESVLEFPGQDRWRWFDGSSVTDQALFIHDAVWAAGADYPDFELSTYGLRIAAPIPSPGTAALAVIFSLTLTRRRRR